METGWHMVSRRVEYLRLFQPEGGARRDCPRRPNLQPPFPRGRIPHPARSDRREKGDSRAGEVHARTDAAFPGPSVAGNGMERDQLQRLFLRHAARLDQVAELIASTRAISPAFPNPNSHVSELMLR